MMRWSKYDNSIVLTQNELTYNKGSKSKYIVFKQERYFFRSDLLEPKKEKDHERRTEIAHC